MSVVADIVRSMKLVSTRIITADVPSLVRFYELVTGADAVWANELFAEILQRMWESSVAQPAVPYVADQPLRPQVLALVEQKMVLLCDAAFIDLARVIFGETIHSPERAQAMVARLNEKETGLNIWIRAAQQDGRIKPGETLEVANLLMSPLKTFAFWPQITLGEPLLAPARQREVGALAVDMFLCYYAITKPE